jgi:hypothetical protein
MVGISVTGLEKGPFLHYQDQSEGFRSALDFQLGVLITCRMLEASVEAVAHSSKEMARFAISLIGKGRVLSRQLLQPQHLYRKVVVREAETGQDSGRHHHRGEREGHKKGLDPQDANSRRSRLSNEHPQPQNLTTSGEPK